MTCANKILPSLSLVQQLTQTLLPSTYCHEGLTAVKVVNWPMSSSVMLQELTSAPGVNWMQPASSMQAPVEHWGLVLRHAVPKPLGLPAQQLTQPWMRIRFRTPQMLGLYKNEP